VGGYRLKTFIKGSPGCKIGLLALALLAALFSLGACLPAAAISIGTPTPSLPPTATATPTSTIVWFPPTATHTPFPTPKLVTPTPALVPPHGAELLRDDFSETGLWQVSKTTAGNVAIGNNLLNIAVNEPRVLLSSLRASPELGDFFLEITASPSLCSGQDEYGLILREVSQADFLRYALSCDGQVRLDRITGGNAASPLPWTLSGAFRPGTLSQVRLAVWAVGEELRFYINDEQQFAWKEPALLSGQIGVFARPASDSPLSVSFSNLAVYQPAPMPTAAPATVLPPSPTP
jgi:hypothetical protein